MAKQVLPLTDTKIKNAKAGDKVQRLSDGDGLYLVVKPTGSKLWRFDYTLDGKRNTLSLGRYPDVSLSKAREMRGQYRERVASGLVPVEKTREDTMVYTVDDAADAFYMLQKRGLSEGYFEKLKRRYELYIKEHIGAMEINSVEPLHIVKMIQAISDNAETAKRVHGITSRIFSTAVTHGKAKRNPANDVDISILVAVVEKKHFAHVATDKDLGEVLKAIDTYKGDVSTLRALQMLPYIFVRPANIRFMRWEELDIEKRVWKIPKEKMKMKRAHMVPLADQVVAMLNDMGVQDKGFVFHSPLSRTAPLSENTLSYGMKRLGFTDVQTPHGFRHTASTLLHENLGKIGVSSEVIEAQLAHEVGGVKGIYNHARYLDDRVRLMQWWADFLDSLKRS